MSYLARHRPICAVLQEIKELAQSATRESDLGYIVRMEALCDEALQYANRMSIKLTQIRQQEERDADNNKR